MQREPELWLRKANATYYVKIDGRQIPLGKDEREARIARLRLLLEQLTGEPESEPSAPVGISVRYVVIRFLWELRQTVRSGKAAERTFDFYRDHLKRFLDFCGKHEPEPIVSVSQVKVHVVTAFLNKRYKASGSTHQNCAVRSVKRAFNYATEQEWIDESPVAKVKAPPDGTFEPEEVLATQYSTIKIGNANATLPLAKICTGQNQPEQGCVAPIPTPGANVAVGTIPRVALKCWTIGANSNTRAYQFQMRLVVTRPDGTTWQTDPVDTHTIYGVGTAFHQLVGPSSTIPEKYKVDVTVKVEQVAPIQNPDCTKVIPLDSFSYEYTVQGSSGSSSSSSSRSSGSSSSRSSSSSPSSSSSRSSGSGL